MPKVKKSPEELAKSCTTPEQAENLIANARRYGNERIRLAAERRLFQLRGNQMMMPGDPKIARYVSEGIAAYEHLVLFRKHGRRIPAHRTRRFVQRYGSKEALILWARRKARSAGFMAMIEAKHPEHTAEYMVAVLIADECPPDAVENAGNKLKQHGVEVLKSLRTPDLG